MKDFTVRDKLETADPQRMVIMVGKSRTGKSITANGLFASKFVTTCDDDIRRAIGCEFDPDNEPLVHQTHELMTKALLLRGYSVVVDAPNLTKDERNIWISMAESSGIRPHVIVIRDPTDAVVWKARCEEDGFPWDVIQDQMFKWEALSEEELGRVTFQYEPALTARNV